MHYFIFEDLSVMNDITDAEPKEVTVIVSLTCISPEESPSGLYGPPEFYDPGSPAEWEVSEIEIIFDGLGKTLSLTEEQLEALFPNGADIINNAIEDAAENGDAGGEFYEREE